MSSLVVARFDLLLARRETIDKLFLEKFYSKTHKFTIN